MILNSQIDLVTEITESGRSAGRNTYGVVITEYKFTCWVLVLLRNFWRHFSVRSVLYSVYSVSNCVF